jgi:uncharacterized protein (TIGR02118 family)
MINVTVMYPNAADKTFDMDYYLANAHPEVKRLSGSALNDVRVSEGIGAAEPGAKPTYRVICDLVFDSIESFHQAYQPLGTAISGDVVNYTTIEAIIQVSAVKL